MITVIYGNIFLYVILLDVLFGGYVMDSIKLKVKICHSDKGMEKLLRSAEPVNNVDVEYETVERFGNYDGQQDILLISDSIKSLIPYFSRNESGIMIIFAGDSSLIFKSLSFFPRNILNIWLTGMPEEYIKFEFNRAMRLLLMRYDAWLYKNWLMALSDSLPDLIWFKDKGGLHWFVNNKFENTVHKTREMCHGKGHNYIWDVPLEDEDKVLQQHLESEREVMEKETLIMSDEIVKTDAGKRHFITYKSPIYGRDGSVAGTVGVGHDMTDLNNTSLELSMLIDNIPMGIMICDEDWKAVEVNDIFEEFFGISDSDLKDFDYNTWKKNNTITIKTREYDEKMHLFQEEVSYKVGDKEYIFNISEQEVHDYFGNITGHYCFFRDITSEREYERVILKQANTDALTGLYNRRYFFDYINAHTDESLTVLFMDMDNFKKINDTLGHNKGDEALVKTSKEILRAFPESLVARLGGDEFAVLADEVLSGDELKKRSEKLVKKIEKDFAWMRLGVSLSVGMAHAKEKIEDVDEFIHESDQMMYEVKQNKKNA